MMFAGIFGAEVDTEKAGELSHHDFVALAHEALIVPLTQSQRTTLLQLFKDFDYDNSETLDRNELTRLLRKQFRIDEYQVDGVSRDVGSNGEITFPEFCWIVARLVRTHEHYWMLLNTWRELT